MGYHYTPNAHLKRFAIDNKPHEVYQYDKVEGKFRTKPTRKAAQEVEYYADTVEKHLNRSIEVPGNKCVDKLMNWRALNFSERQQFAAYVFNMHARGPYSRKRNERIARRLVPSERKKFDSVRKYLVLQASQLHDIKLAARAQAALLELDKAVENIYEKSDFVQSLIKKPHESPLSAAIIFAMDWHLIVAPPETFFITSDTPATFFECYGLIDIDCEVTFTMSKKIALIGTSYQANGSTIWHHRSTPDYIEEINRRIISTTDRYVFSSQKADWIVGFAQDPELKSKCLRIRWGT